MTSTPVRSRLLAFVAPDPERGDQLLLEGADAPVAGNDPFAIHDDERALVAYPAEHDREILERDPPVRRELVAVELFDLDAEACLARAPFLPLSDGAVGDLAERAILPADGLPRRIQEHGAEPAVQVVQEDEPVRSAGRASGPGNGRGLVVPCSVLHGDSL